jgi:predicted nucleic acid-binding Zn finger protein
LAKRTRKRPAWRWPARLNPYIPDIVAKYRSGGMKIGHIAAEYRVMDCYIRELLKSSGVFVYTRPNSVRKFYRTIEEKREALVDRKCLHCQRNFQSESVGNRICSPCKALAGFKDVVSEGDFPGGHIR